MNKEKVYYRQDELKRLLKTEKQKNTFACISRCSIIAAGALVLILTNIQVDAAHPLTVGKCISISAVVYILMDLIIEEIKRSIDYKYTKQNLLHKIQVDDKISERNLN